MLTKINTGKGNLPSNGQLCLPWHQILSQWFSKEHLITASAYFPWLSKESIPIKQRKQQLFSVLVQTEGSGNSPRPLLIQFLPTQILLCGSRTPSWLPHLLASRCIWPITGMQGWKMGPALCLSGLSLSLQCWHFSRSTRCSPFNLTSC